MQTGRIILIELILNTQLRWRPCRPQSRRSVVTSAANKTQPFNSTGTSKKIHPYPRSQLTESRKQEKKKEKKRRLSDHDALLRELVLNAGRLHLVQKKPAFIIRLFCFVMPSGMFSIDSILSGQPSCKEPLLLHRSGPAVLPAGLSESLYTDYSGLYSATCGPSPTGIQPVSGGTRIGYNGYYYGQLHVQASGGGAPCCLSVPSLNPQQCPCIPAGRTHTRSH